VWMRFEVMVGTVPSRRCHLLPAVVPVKIASARALLAAANVAERARRRLCVRLCATELDAQRYKETWFFTELGLLSYLSLLTNATIFDLSQVSRNDALLLNGTPAGLVCAPGSVNEWLTERPYAPLSLAHRAIGFASNGSVLADGLRYASLLSLSMALIKKSNSEVQAADLVVEALTRSAATALGIDDLGTIAANMKGDLCIFDRPSRLGEACNSLDFLNLLASRRPRYVVVEGVPLVIEGAFVQPRVMAEG
jgi:Amidohydrolase family